MRYRYSLLNRKNIIVAKKLFLYDNTHMLPVTTVKDYLCNGHQYYLVETLNKGDKKTHLVKKTNSEIFSK
uniref:Uncharacterized protein n=1 Tax=Megaviridae environmental sample TaxID=1737588 RepID=A0A5J6VM85_9VIRU|nr:MAG: hypothetical protein [Megaviridae environmental sample]